MVKTVIPRSRGAPAALSYAAGMLADMKRVYPTICGKGAALFTHFTYVHLYYNICKIEKTANTCKTDDTCNG